MTVAAAITHARTVLQATLFRDSVTIVRQALLDDGRGGQYPDPSGPTEIGPILGAFSRLTGRELIAAEQLQQHGTYRLALPVATDIRATDQVRFGSVTYNVVWAPPLTGMNLSRVVGLDEV